MDFKLFMRWASMCFVIIATPCTAATAVDGPYQFVATYIRILDALESIRDKAEKEMIADGDAGQLAGCVRNMEAFQLELNADIPTLRAMQLSGATKGVPQQFADFFEIKRNLYRQMSDGCTQMIEGPKPGVDYGALAAAAPKINAQIDYVDNSIFKATPLVFATLIGPMPDAKGHMNHLSITRAQMNTLARLIKLDFGKKLNMKNQNYMVSAASVLYFYLVKKGYKGSDEP